MSAAVLPFPCPAVISPAIEPDHGDCVDVNGIAVGVSYWPQLPGREDRAWIAWYWDDEPDDLGTMNIGNGSSRERAISNLFFLFPREN